MEWTVHNELKHADVSNYWNYIDVKHVCPGTCTQGNIDLHLVILPWMYNDSFSFSFNNGKTPKKIQQKFLD